MAKSKIGEPKPAKTKKTLIPEIVDKHSELKTKTVRSLTRSEKISDEQTVDPDLKALAPADPITVYMSEIRKYPLLTREQEFELAKKYYETKDPAVAQALVTANLRFVVKVAAEYSKFGARLIDLVQEGNMGLMHAVRDFNPYKGVRLITYAVWWIKGYIQEYLMKQYSMVKIGTTQNQKRLFYQLKKEKEALDSMGESANIKLIADKMGIPEEEVKIMAQRMTGRDVSLSATVDDDSTIRLEDLQKNTAPAPDEELSKFEEIDKLKETIETLRPELSEREKIILQERLLNDEPLTLQEIGDKYGITREAVRQMEVRLMQKIKNRLPSLR
jgi:RNA polymerase sigma-32 factor